MQPALTFTIASVGAEIVGSSTSERRMSPAAWMVVARMASSLQQARSDPPRGQVCVISHVSYRG
jgi:hypothetical protein